MAAAKLESKIVSFKVLGKEDQEAEAAARAKAEAPEAPAVDYDPSGEILPSAPMGTFPAQRFGAEYHHPTEGKQSLFVLASYFPVKGLQAGEEVAANRLFETWVPAGQRKDIQPWITATMKLASLCLQLGAPPSRVFKRFDCPGSENILFPVLGGKKKFFTSEVQIVGEALKCLANDLGFLDVEGMDIPFFKRAVPLQPKAVPTVKAVVTEKADGAQDAPAAVSGDAEYPAHATVCSKCGVKAVVRLDGCDTCLNCSDSKCG